MSGNAMTSCSARRIPIRSQNSSSPRRSAKAPSHRKQSSAHGEPWEIDSTGVLLAPLTPGIVADAGRIDGIMVLHLLQDVTGQLETLAVWGFECHGKHSRPKCGV